MSDGTLSTNTVPAESAAAFSARLGIAPDAPASGGLPLAGRSEVPRLAEDGASEETVALDQPRALETLAAYIRKVFRQNATARQTSRVDERMRETKLSLDEQYNERDRALIEAVNAPELYFGFDGVKFRAGVASLSEIEAIGQGKCWTLAPTPWPDMPKRVKDAALELAMEDVQELLRLCVALVKSGRKKPEELQGMLPPPAHMEMRTQEASEEARRKEKEVAEKACERMEARIDDQFTEGRFEPSLQKAIQYASAYGTAVVYGPTPRARTKVVGEDRPDGRREIKTELSTEPEYEVVSPLDCYPAPGAQDIDDGPFIRKVRYSPAELAAFARSEEDGAAPWRRDAIEKILKAFPNGGVSEDAWMDWSLVDLETDATLVGSNTCQIEGLQFFGDALGGDLLAIGITKDTKGKAIRETEYYEVEAVTILDFVVCCRVTEPEIGRPLSKVVFEEKLDSWWGKGVFDLVRAPQRALNSVMRSALVNAAQSSGPLVEVDTTRFLGDLTVRPWKRFDKIPAPAGTQPDPEPFKIHNIPSNLSELLAFKANMKTDIEEFSTILSIAYGQTAGAPSGITRTASLYSMVSENSTKTLKQVARGFDRMVRRIVMKTYAWNMLYAKDESLKLGDVRCNPSGVLGYLVVEQNYNKLLQFFQMTANPTDMQLIGTKGRAFLLREIAKRLGLNPDRVIPSPEKLEEAQLLNEAKEQAALEQQEANLEATRAGTEGVEQRNAGGAGQEGGTPPSAPVQDTAEDTAATPSPAPGTNARRAQSAALRRLAQGGGAGGPGSSPSAQGTIRQTQLHPQQRAAQGAASAATRRGA